MESVSLTALAEEQLALARTSSAGRSAKTVHGAHELDLRQTVIALATGQTLAEHESPAEATLQVLSGRVRLGAGDESWEGSAGDFLIIPRSRHDLSALEDSAVLLSVATGTHS